MDDLEIPLPGRRLGSVLALLVARVGEAVGADALVEATWGDSRPVRAVQALETLVWRLRSALEPGRSARTAGTVLRTEAAGYRLAVPEDTVDSRRFATAARQAGELLAQGESAQALEVSENALTLWRGEPFEAVLDAQWMEPVRQYLAGLRLDLAECHVQALLEVGQPERAVRQLVPLLAENPFRERYWAQRMLALYRSGRQAAALDAFAEARRVLSEELGVDPGPELRALHEQILAQVDSLDGPRAGQSASVTDPPVVLPSRRVGLIGRDDDVSSVAALFERHRLVTLIGPGGAGKTRLAVEVAHRLRHRYHDGVWFVDLTTADVGAGLSEISDNVATVLELSAQPGITSQRLVLDQLAQRRLLLVLDNCEHVVAAAAELTDDLLDRCPGVAVLATSREPLATPDGHDFLVDPLARGAAATLFVDRLSNLRPDLDPQGADRAMIDEICTAVGGLPLGIELAAARARVFELREIAASLASGPARLERRGRGPARQASMLDTVDWSYRLARPDEQSLHRRLGCLPGPFTLDAARAVCTVAPLSSDQAPELISGLVHTSLLSTIRPSRGGGPTLFRQLVPTRAHADSVVDAGERAEVESARDEWVVGYVTSAPLDGRIGQAEALSWVEDNMTAVRAALTSTLTTRPTRSGLDLVARLTLFWFERGRMVEASRWFQATAALPMSLSLSECDTAVAAALNGCAHGLIQDRAVAEVLLGAQLPGLVDPPQERAELVGQVLVLIAAAAWVCRLPDIGLGAATAAITVGQRLDHPHVTIRARALQAMHQLGQGDRVTSLPAIEAVLADPQGNEFAAFVAAYASSRAAREAGDARAALRWMQRAAQAHRIMASHPTSELLEDVARLLDLTGSPAEALRCLAAAAALHADDGLRWPRMPETTALLDQLHDSMSSVEYERIWAAGLRLGHGQPEEVLDEWL